MQNDISGVNQAELLRWIESSIKTGSNIISHGYQGHIYFYEDKDLRLVVKAPMGWGIGKFIRRIMLRNEFRAYSKLSSVKGIPRCFGFLKKSYLVLQFIDGVSVKSARITDREHFYKAFLDLIERQTVSDHICKRKYLLGNQIEGSLTVGRCACV